MGIGDEWASETSEHWRRVGIGDERALETRGHWSSS